MDSINDDECVQSLPANDMKRDLRCSVWTLDDELSLANMKREQFKRELSERNYKLTPALHKWDDLTTEFNKENKKFYNAAHLMNKWRNMVTDFKKIFHYQAKSGAEDWWAMSDLKVKKEVGLSLNKVSFSQELFVLLASFLGERPSVNGKHVMESGVDETQGNGPDKDEFSSRKKRKIKKEEKLEEAEMNASISSCIVRVL